MIAYKIESQIKFLLKVGLKFAKMLTIDSIFTSLKALSE